MRPWKHTGIYEWFSESGKTKVHKRNCPMKVKLLFAVVAVVALCYCCFAAVCFYRPCPAEKKWPNPTNKDDPSRGTWWSHT